MTLLRDKERSEIQAMFKNLASEITLLYFTQEFECAFCGQTRQLLEELAPLCNRLKLEVHDFQKEADLAASHGVDKIPAIVLLRGKQDVGIRFYGVPAGYEFATLLEAIRMVAMGDSGLSKESRSLIAGLKEKVHLQVYVTPT